MPGYNFSQAQYGSPLTFDSLYRQYMYTIASGHGIFEHLGYMSVGKLQVILCKSLSIDGDTISISRSRTRNYIVCTQ